MVAEAIVTMDLEGAIKAVGGVEVDEEVGKDANAAARVLI